MRSLMKVEFRNAPVYFRSDVFNEFKQSGSSNVPAVIIKNPQQPAHDEVVISNKKKAAIGTGAAAGIGGIVWLISALKGKNNKTVPAKIKEVKEAGEAAAQSTLDILKSGFKSVMDAFPDDFAYIKNLARNMGLKEGEEFKLNSVMGKSQLKKLLDEFTAEDFSIKNDFEGARNMTFRVNLHNHTQFSDGKLSVADFLEQARKYADRIAANKPADNKPPFTIAITDHDTMEGCKEALKILSENPEKFKNLKVVLGSEISVSNNDSKILAKPLNFELVGYSQNPYDENLSKLLANIQKTRQENVEKFLTQINEKYPGYNLNLDEAKTFHANLRNMRTNGVLYLAGDYSRFKIALCEHIKKINEILPENVEKLSAEKLFPKFGEDFYYRMDAFGEKDINEYFSKHGLRDYLTENGLITKENEKNFEKIFNLDLKEKEKFINESVQKGLPTIDDRKQYTLDPSDVFNASTEGFYGFAHPAIIDFPYDNISAARRAYCDQNSYKYNENLVFEIFNSLKQSGKEKFIASEINYQSYPSDADRNWIDFMKNSIADNETLKLKYTGGIDAHKPSIFIKHKFIDEKILKELLGE